MQPSFFVRVVPYQGVKCRIACLNTGHRRRGTALPCPYVHRRQRRDDSV